jgi:ubiquitin carboxyl-terminal hydrolase 4/11/15
LNASLQALLHTEHLVDYFLSKRFFKDINVDNKDGYRGRLALAFDSLCQDMWLTSSKKHFKKSISPAVLHREVSHAREQFAGFLKRKIQLFMQNLFE